VSALQKITRLEDAKKSIQKEINVLNTRIAAETENFEGLSEGLKKNGSTQSSLGQEMRACEKNFPRYKMRKQTRMLK
jgi:septal ring factor EnvC (AmiA/AmiB activator)